MKVGAEISLPGGKGFVCSSVYFFVLAVQENSCVATSCGNATVRVWRQQYATQSFQLTGWIDEAAISCFEARTTEEG